MAIGISQGKFSPCPDSPNCVSSQSPDPSHFVEPLSYTDSQTDAKARLLKLIESMPRTQIISNTDNYIHAEFTSLIFRFVDDVEFLFDPDQNLIQVRSGSRVGYSDLGMNRKRIEAIRQQFRQ
ncbi:MAG: DUF1499 domain-containing protein [Nitrospirota bacterium]|nr:MAG: DUF1499 domain-containing protein [Nitrospirota bacterium]